MEFSTFSILHHSSLVVLIIAKWTIFCKINMKPAQIEENLQIISRMFVNCVLRSVPLGRIFEIFAILTYFNYLSNETSTALINESLGNFQEHTCIPEMCVLGLNQMCDSSTLACFWLCCHTLTKYSLSAPYTSHASVVATCDILIHHQVSALCHWRHIRCHKKDTNMLGDKCPFVHMILLESKFFNSRITLC